MHNFGRLEHTQQKLICFDFFFFVIFSNKFEVISGICFDFAELTTLFRDGSQKYLLDTHCTAESERAIFQKRVSRVCQQRANTESGDRICVSVCEAGC